MTVWNHPHFDPAGAIERVAEDMGRDWVMDPIYRSDTLEALTDEPTKIQALFETGALPRRGFPVPVPKTSLTVRPAVDLRVIDRVAYQTLVDTFAFDALSDLPSFVCGWRYEDDPSGPADLADNSSEWRRYEALLEAEWDAGFEFVLVTDVAGFFQNIPHRTLRERFEGIADRHVRNGLNDYLRIWNPRDIGLPQRVLGSSLLANAYLEPVDEVLADYRSIRWMDDIAVFCSSRREGVDAALRIQEALSSVNLSVNEAKTRLLGVEDATDLVDFIKFRGIEYELSRKNEDGEKGLADAWADAIHDLDRVDRTRFSFCVSRFIENDWDDPAAEVLASLNQLPHVSDHISRYLRALLDDPKVLSAVLTFLRSRQNLFNWQEYRLSTLFWHAERLSQEQLAFVRRRASSANTYWAARNVYFRALARHGTRADGRLMMDRADQEGNLETVRGLIIGAAESRAATRGRLRQMARDDGDLQGLVRFLLHRDLAVPPLSF